MVAPVVPGEGGGPTDRLLAWADRNRYWVFLAIAVLYLAGFNGRWRVSSDSALYASLGRNLAEGRGFSYLGEPHNWAEPALPALVGASFRLFGEGDFRPVMAAMLLMAGAALALNYWLFRLHAGRPTAVVVTSLLAVCENFFRYAYHLFTDLPFLVGVLAFLVGYERVVKDVRRLPWLGWVLMAAAVTWMAAFRPIVITFLGALSLAVAWHVVRGRQRRRHLLVLALAVASFLVFRFVDPRRSSVAQADYRESKLKTLLTERGGFLARRALTVSLPMVLDEHVPEAVFALDLGRWVDAVPSAVVLGLAVALVRVRALWGLWVAATLAQLVIWVPRERYLLPVLPLILYALWRSCAGLSSRPGRWGGVAAAALLALLTVPNLAMSARFAVRQHTAGFYEEVGGGQYFSFRELAEQIRKNTEPEDLVMADEHRVLAYFSGRRVVGAPSSLRDPPTAADRAAFAAKVAAAPRLFVVLPPDRLGDMERERVDLSLRVDDQPLASVARRDRGKVKPDRPWTLHRLLRPGER